MPSKAEFARTQGVRPWFKLPGEPRVLARRLRTAGRNALIAAAALVVLCVDLPAPTVGDAAVDPQGRLEAQAARPGGLAGFEDVVERVKPAVFGIRARVVERGDESEQPLPPLEGEESDKTKPEEPKRARLALSQGSGFFISEDGYAVTAYHVIEGGTSIEISTDDGKTHRAKVVGVDSETDIAILKVDAEESYPFVAFADRMPRIGEWVITVGNPFGLGGTVTAGIVSAGTREIEVGTKSDFIQIDAPVNQGNSGGPAFDVAGRVIGVNSAIISPTGGSVGIGFAIPAAIVRPVVAQLKEKGVVTRGWMGVETQAVTPELADGFGLKQTRGALVAERRPNGPAARAGIRPGDVILTLNGQTLDDDRDLARRIGAMAPGKSVHLGILRQGREHTLAVGLSRSPQAKTAAATDPGNTLGDGADPEKLGLGLAPGKQGDEGRDALGVVVVEVDPQGIAAERGFLPGDVILDVGGSAVTLPSDVSEALAKARKQRRNNVVARVRTGESTRFVALPTG